MFGNQHYIDIAKCLSEINKLEASLKEKEEAAKSISKIKERVNHLKGQAVYLLKAYGK